MEYDNDSRKLYGDLAWLWPIMSSPEEYAEESELFSETIKTHSRLEPRTLLHLGCGGGMNDHTLKRYFQMTGVDISEEMLKLARDLNPEVRYVNGDMRTIRLGECFDAVIIGDSINYMRTAEELRRAFLTAYEHLNPGGVFLTVVEEMAEKFKQNRTVSSCHSQGDIELTFIENGYDPDPSDTSYEETFIYLIRRKGKLEIQTDHHILGIFRMNVWQDLLKEAGFEVEQMKFEHSTLPKGDYLPMLVCAKPL
jgi:SAM-dependent methyltransferase